MKSLAEVRSTTGAYRCLDCGKCASTCPINGEEGVSARMIARRGLYDPPEAWHKDVLACRTCGACEERCPEGVRFTEFVRGLRIHDDPAREAPCPHDGLFNSLARAMAGPEPPKRSLEWLGEGLRVADEGEVALFVGCLPFFDAYFAEDLGIETVASARAAVRLLNHLGIEPVVLAEERCCGHDQLWRGEVDTFRELARANARSYSERGIKHILSVCAECTRTWRLDYPEVVPDYSPKVEHLAEFLAPRLAAGELRFRENGQSTLTYQDPCRLGHHMHVLDPPRQILEAIPGAELLEMARSGQDAICCGTCGFVACDSSSKRLQNERLESAAATGADSLVTSCPKCLIHFSCAQADARRRGDEPASITVRDIATIAADLLDASPADDRTTGESS